MARSFGRAFANKLVSEIIKEKNRRRRAIVQAEQKLIRDRQRAIAKKERERQTTIKKAQKARYVVNRKTEGNRKTDAVLAYYDIYHKIIHEALSSKTFSSFRDCTKGIMA